MTSLPLLIIWGRGHVGVGGNGDVAGQGRNLARCVGSSWRVFGCFGGGREHGTGGGVEVAAGGVILASRGYTEERCIVGLLIMLVRIVD